MLLRYPELAARDCKDCWQFVYDERTGRREQWRGGSVKRPKGTAPPCCHQKCKKISPDSFMTLLPHNYMAYEHYLECKATGHFPDDPIVKRNARIIRSAEEEVAKIERIEDKVMSFVPSNGKGLLR